MNADEVRAKAIDKIAEAEYLHWVRYRADESVWADCRGFWRERFMEKATRAVDALGDLLPTQSEWYVVYDDPDHGKVLSTFCQRREDAEHQIRCNEDEFHDGRSSLARRFLTAWLEVTE